MGKTVTKPEQSAEEFLPLTPAMFHILLALADRERHGYHIMQEVEQRTEGRVRLGPGTLYGSIKRMLAAGWIEETKERPDRDLDDERLRYYRLTDLGYRIASAEAERLERLVKSARVEKAAFKNTGDPMSASQSEQLTLASSNWATQVYCLLLRGYPSAFRTEYGTQMAQLFRDCCLAETRDGGLQRLTFFWFRTLLDFIRTAPQEHLANLGKENSTMKNSGRDAVALLGSIGIIVLAAAAKNETGCLVAY